MRSALNRPETRRHVTCVPSGIEDRQNLFSVTHCPGEVFVRQRANDTDGHLAQLSVEPLRVRGDLALRPVRKAAARAACFCPFRPAR
jgi:hypothetical protein